MLWWQNLKHIMYGGECVLYNQSKKEKKNPKTKLLTADDELVLSAGFGILISFQQSPLEELFVGT